MGISGCANRLGVLLCCLASALGASAAGAQELDPDDTGSPRNIIVMANKRADRLLDVPISISLVDHEQILQRNITDVSHLTRAVPSLNGALDTLATALSIRGIGTATFSFSSESSVGVVLDGVSLAGISDFAPQLFDVARIEVLEGPQVTLYGRNASAGLVNVVTNQPDPQGRAMVGRIQAGSRRSGNVQGAVNIPLSSGAALRIAGAYDLGPRTIHDRHSGSFDQTRSASVRGRLRAGIGERTTLDLAADYNRRERDGGAVLSVYRTTGPASPVAALLAACGVTASDDNSSSCADGENRRVTKTYGFSARIERDLGPAVLTSISAYRHLDTAGTIDIDAIPLNIINRNLTASRTRNLSQEIRISSAEGQAIDYVAGLYLLDSRQDHATELAGQALSLLLPQNNPLRLLPFGRSSESDVSSTSLAAFADATIGLTDRLKGSVGIRVGHERLRESTRRMVAEGAVATFPPLLGDIGDLTGHDSRSRDTYFSYRLGATYELSGDARAYVTFTRGYKAAAVNDNGSGNVVRPETPLAWEGGVKLVLLDERALLSISAFHTRVKNFQTRVYDQASNSFDFANAPRLYSKGAQLSLFGRLSPHFSMTMGIAYTDARYGKGFIVPCAPGQTAAAGCETFTGPDGSTFTGDEVNGNRLQSSPKWKATVSADLTLPMKGGMVAFFQPDLVFTSPLRFSQAFDPNRTTGSHVIVGGRIGVRDESGKLSLAIYARNLFDDRVPTFRGPVATAPLTGDPLAYFQTFGPESFRTIGASISFSL